MRGGFCEAQAAVSASVVDANELAKIVLGEEVVGDRFRVRKVFGDELF